MEKKKSKGFFSVLFAPKSGSGCCNVQFEEITEEKPSEEKEVENLDNKKERSKEPLEINKGNPLCGCR